MSSLVAFLKQISIYFQSQQDDNPFGDVRNSFGSFAASPPHRQSHDTTPTGDLTLEPPVSPRTSVDSKSQFGSSPPKFLDEPKFSLASPQPSQSIRNSSHKSLQDVKQSGTENKFSLILSQPNQYVCIGLGVIVF